MERIVYIPRFTGGEGTGSFHAGLGRALALARASGTVLVLLAPGERWEGLLRTMAPHGVGPAPGGRGRVWASRRASRRWPGRSLAHLARDLGTPRSLCVKVTESRRGCRGIDRALLRNLPGHVWLLPEEQPTGRNVVLAALQLPGPAASPLDRLVLRAATALAHWEGARLHLVHAWDLVGESILASNTRGIGPHPVRRLLRAREMAMRSRIRTLLEAEGLDPDHPAIVGKGDPVRVLRQAAEATGARTLVAGHVGAAGAWGRIAGNALEELLGIEGLGLFAIRPEGPPLSAPPRSPGARHDLPA